MANNWQRWKNIMKAYPFEEKRLTKWQPPYIVQPKYNGYRCRAVPLANEKFILLSAEENIFYSVPHINRAMNESRIRIETDGEAYCHGMNFDTIQSIMGRSTNLHPDHSRMAFHIFDYPSNELQMERTLKLSKWEVKPPLYIAPFWLCESYEEILKIYNELIAWGYEGMIVRNAYAPYIRKRSTLMMKFKEKQSDKYKIVGYKEEISINGIPKDCLGALIFESGDGNIFSAGNFTDEEKYLLWKIRDKLPGKICTVNYQHLNPSGVPRHAHFGEDIEWVIEIAK